MVEVQLLGPPRVGGASELLKVTGRQRALLAVLALHARRTVSAHRLVEVVWGDDELPQDPLNALQQRISALRRILDPHRSGGVLVQGHEGYTLKVADEQIDVARFEQLVGQGKVQLREGDAAGAEDTLSRALELWRGPALDGVADEPWAIGVARRLEELRLATVEARMEAMLALGQHAEVVGDLADLVAAHPFRERLRGALMVALYRAGRQADALELYDEARQMLAEQLGVDPDPHLQQVYAQILHQADDLAAPATGSGGPLGNLPAPRSTVLGRVEALGQVGSLLDHARLVTLTGPGGAGKTTLAIEAARRRQGQHPDGVWLVELAAVTIGEAVPTTIAEALGVAAGGLAAGGGSDHLVSAVAGKGLLLVLDNCEHLVDAVAPLVERLVDAAPGLRVVATSREPLQVYGEVVWSVPALALAPEEAVTAEEVCRAPAVQMLVERARAHTADFSLTDHTAAAAATVVRRLDGLPLAIELAAAKLRVLSLGELAEGLDDRFRLLTVRSRTARSGQRTLRGALDWSWDLLDDDLRCAWASLAVPAGPFEVGTAAPLLAAAGVQDDPLETIVDLVDRSLLDVDTSATPTRYRMLESLREYGQQRLDEAGLGDEVRSRHADMVEAALAACHGAASPDRFGVDIDGLAGWLDDARAAMGWAQAAGDRLRVARLASRLGWLWLLRGLSSEGLAWLDIGLGTPAAVGATDVEHAPLLWSLALRAAGAVSLDDRYARLAVTTAPSEQDRVVAQVFVAIHHANTGRFDAAVRALDGCMAEAQRLGGWPLGFVRLMAAQTARFGGQQDRARHEAEDALALLRDAQAQWGQVYALDVLIDDLMLRGDYGRARDLALEALELSRRQRFPELEVTMLCKAGLAMQEVGASDDAIRYLEQAVIRAAGIPVALGGAHTAAGTAARRRGQQRLAQQHLRAALDALTGTQAVLTMLWARTQLAHVLASERRSETAEHAAAALDLAHRVGDPRALALALEAHAAALSHTKPGVAATLLATAAAIRRQSGIPTPPPEQHDIDRTLEQISEHIDPRALDDAWATAYERALTHTQDAVSEMIAAHGRAAV